MCKLCVEVKIKVLLSKATRNMKPRFGQMNSHPLKIKLILGMIHLKLLCYTRILNIFLFLLNYQTTVFLPFRATLVSDGIDEIVSFKKILLKRPDLFVTVHYRFYCCTSSGPADQWRGTLVAGWWTSSFRLGDGDEVSGVCLILI